MVRAGEAGASLETVLERLAEFIERKEATREHITSALLYPAIVALTCCASIAILFLFVVPRFRPLFEQSAGRGIAELPAPAQVLLAISDLIDGSWWAGLILLALLALLIAHEIRHPPSRRRWQLLLLRVPLAGEIARKVEVARFGRTLGTLLKNGVSLLPALEITRDTLRNPAFTEAVTAIIDQAQTGKGLAEPMRQSRVFPALATHLARVGEESGRQDEMLVKIADIFDAETRRNIDRMLSLVAPAVTIVLGVVVAGVILSILTALLSVYELTM
jgi:general secretion pathway protein F